MLINCESLINRSWMIWTRRESRVSTLSGVRSRDKED